VAIAAVCAADARTQIRMRQYEGQKNEKITCIGDGELLLPNILVYLLLALSLHRRTVTCDDDDDDEDDVPVAIETSGVMNQLAVDLVSEIGRRITSVTEDTRETMFLFQRLSVALQRGNAVSFLATFANSEV